MTCAAFATASQGTIPVWLQVLLGLVAPIATLGGVLVGAYVNQHAAHRRERRQEARAAAGDVVVDLFGLMKRGIIVVLLADDTARATAAGDAAKARAHREEFIRIRAEARAVERDLEGREYAIKARVDPESEVMRLFQAALESGTHAFRAADRALEAVEKNPQRVRELLGIGMKMTEFMEDEIGQLQEAIREGRIAPAGGKGRGVSRRQPVDGEPQPAGEDRTGVAR